MPIQNPLMVKEKILSILRMRGPSFPVRIARETGLSILFASAFLSEILSEKRIKISHMKIGSSPLYFIPGQEHLLENFSQHLKSKEKEAFLLLKEKKLLKDSEQTPAIRVALREIKDFAVPFRKEEEIFWRYFTIPEEEPAKPEIKKEEIQKETKEEIKKIEITEEREVQEEKLQSKIQKKDRKNKISGKKERKNSDKKNEKFFEKIKAFLFSKNIEILDIKSFNKNELVLRVKNKEKEELIIAYNKKRITEEDIIKAHKKALEENKRYRILYLGEPIRKIENLVNAVKDLEGIEKAG